MTAELFKEKMGRVVIFTGTGENPVPMQATARIDKRPVMGHPIWRPALWLNQPQRVLPFEDKLQRLAFD